MANKNKNNKNDKKNNSNNITAREKRSVSVLGVDFPKITSGAIYPGVPPTPRFEPYGATLSLSQISTSPVFLSMKKFPGLISW